MVPSEGVGSFRPPQPFLDLFWQVSDSDSDSKRQVGALKISEYVSNAEGKDQVKLINYCKQRLVKGLSSNRKFARVGFSLTLTQVLRDHPSLSNEDVVESVKNALQVQGERKSKGELGSIFLGRAFAYSALIQSGRLEKMASETRSSMIKDVVELAGKKSYMQPVCYQILEDALQQISIAAFGDELWPDIREAFKQGWEGCTLDKLALLIVTKTKFPDVVNKKFLRKHWGYPLLSEENDEKLLKVISTTVFKRSELLLNKVLPEMLKQERSAVSIWKGIGEPLLKQDAIGADKNKKAVKGPAIGLKLAGYLIKESLEDSSQLLEFLTGTSLAKSIFHNNTTKKDVMAITGDDLFSVLRDVVSAGRVNTGDLAGKLLSMAPPSAKTPSLASSANYIKLLSLMTREEASQFSNMLISSVNSTDDISTIPGGLEACVRCLHHTATAQALCTEETQKTVLTLLLRLAFFKVDKASKKLPNCSSKLSLTAGSTAQELCKTLLFKALDQLSTMITVGKTKSTHFEGYIELLCHIAKYFQTLKKAKGISPIQSWPEELFGEWDKMCEFINKVKNKEKDAQSLKDKAFLLVMLYVAFQMLIDFKSSSDLLQEIRVCFEKACNEKTSQNDSEVSEEPLWMEVMVEVLLSLMSQPSHLGRTVATRALGLLAPHVTAPAVALITQVLIPRGRHDNADGAMVEAEDGNASDDEEGSLIDEDEPSDESDDEESSADEEVESENEEDEDEDMEVDEKFRASVKEALGQLAVKGEDDDGQDDKEEDEESLPDLSDSEMSKLDDMLAEVFRQKKKVAQGKKAKEGKKKELVTFRLRSLDLVEALIGSQRCGDFVLELLQPLLLLTLRMGPDSQDLADKASQLIKQIKSKSKLLEDSIHSPEDQKKCVEELLILSRSVSDRSSALEVTSAIHVAMSLKYENNNSENVCNKLIEDLLIKTSQGKGALPFFLSLIGHDTNRYQFLYSKLLEILKDPEAKLQRKLICCTVLSHLIKDCQGEQAQAVKALMVEVAHETSKNILSLNKENIQPKFTQSLLELALALMNKNQVFTLEELPFDGVHKKHIISIKSKMNTDVRKLCNQFVSKVPSESKNSKKRKADNMNGDVKDENSEPCIEQSQNSKQKKQKKQKKSKQSCLEEPVNILDENPQEKKRKTSEKGTSPTKKKKKNK